jgi:hypothetical protein
MLPSATHSKGRAPSLRLGYRASNPFRRFLRAQTSADVGCGFFLLHGGEHRLIDPLGFFGKAQMLKHHGRRGDCADRISDVLARKRRRGAVHGLKH